METRRLETLKQIAAGVAAQFGSNCEVVIHDVSGNRPDHTIVHIENGHVSGRKVGDGASQVVLDQLARQDEQPKDHLCYQPMHKSRTQSTILRMRSTFPAPMLKLMRGWEPPVMPSIGEVMSSM